MTSASPSPSSSRPVCRPPLDHSRHFSPRARHARVVQHSSSRPEVRLHRTARSRARLAPRSPPRPRARRCPSVPERETLPYARQSRRFVARSRGAGTIERRLPRAIGVRQVAGEGEALVDKLRACAKVTSESFGAEKSSAVSVLDDILSRMQAHQVKKQSMLRELHVAHRVGQSKASWPGGPQ